MVSAHAGRYTSRVREGRTETLLDLIEAPSDPEGDLVLRRVRWRLVALAAVTLALVMGLAILWQLAVAPDGRLHGGALAPLAALAVLIPGALGMLTRRAIAPVQEMADSSDRLMELYNRARLDALLDPLTGLGNHRAFQD